MELIGKNIIGNDFSGEGKDIFFAVNPSTGKQMEPGFKEASQKEIDSAVRKASTAFQVYRNKSGQEKAEFLETIANEIMSLGDSLISRCIEETGLPEGRLTGERGRTVNQLKLFAKLLREGSWVDARIDTADPDRQPLPKADIRSMLKGLGPVGVFGASNFPLAFSVAGGDTASALAAGCTVVVKGHPAHPGTSEMVGLAIQRAVQKCNMPEGTFSMVNGPSVEVGQAIVRHPLIKAIGFTGSFRGGKALFDEANKREEPIPVYSEMGSSNPVFILPGALKERKDKIAQDLAASVNLGVGQFCTSPGLVFLQSSEDTEGFKNLLSQSISESDAGIMLTSGINGSYREGIEKLSSKNNVEVLAKGKEESSSCRGTSYLLHTTAQSFLSEHSLQEEIFGPSTLAITAQHKDEIVKAAENLYGHLTITIHGTEEDLLEHQDLIRVLEQKTGRIIINGYPTGVEVCDSMVHGGPFPATTDSRSTSVGTAAIKRFVRPVCYQSFPTSLLPDELKDGNPLKIWRLVNGDFKKE
ncbi:aldehyde dehydrogenase (NADP(+)) [Autumnicola psychrophila]|uniref:Aldehyde dehydrogenase (NADP(+)) n=1 Tax=Autumnicola psychrophila TaxID=3075592 RepID=A0ABU3DMN6_9FLAO|nr:aldehyde dehydrogenase (NADP(+)) [Zunongwangia sp. F225]MDT0684979.1 aldehyde dehydrogenase (NADP(+)) [Zunongwangia sp. F225]